MSSASGVRSLRILGEEHPLRREGEFLRQYKWPDDAAASAPRALRGLARIVDGGLCHRCGSCVGICPTGVLARSDEEYPTIVNLSACTDCDLCVKVCPGDEFNADYFHQQLFSSEGETARDAGGDLAQQDRHNTHGHFEDGLIAYATDPDIRERSTSGGLVTAILLDMLDRGEIDGAITIASDEGVLWKGKPQIARTREEILASMKSKYAITSTNSMLAEVRAVPGRYALVGLPCQIHGFLKAAALDERLRERVVLTIGLFCHASIEHEAYKILWDSLGDKAQQAKRFISRIGKHPGTPYLELEDGSLSPVYFPQAKGYRPTSIEMINILYRLYTPARCLTCYDATAEFADIAVGDPWMAPPEDDVDFYQGWTFALARTQRGARICKDLEERKKIKVVTLTESETLKCNTLMANEKRWRAFRVIETQRRQGKPIPDYGFEIPKASAEHAVKTELHMLSHIFCFLPRIRGAVLKFMLGSGGYWMLWVNHKRRAFRFWRRDTKAWLKRRLVGRR